MKRRLMMVGCALFLAAPALACEAEGDDSLRKGGGIWIGNGLEDPDVSGVDPAAGLDTPAGLDPGGTLLADADGLAIATYLVECALPEGQIIAKTRADGQTLLFAGALGLAPEWQDGACGPDCQQWVSACMLARTNASGEPVGLWLSADHPAIGLGHDSDHPLHEATFYGNLFQEVPARHLCHGPNAGGSSALGEQLRSRTCDGLPLEECGFTEWGACKDDGRCTFVGGLPTDCRAGVAPLLGHPHHAITTFVAIDG